MIGVKKMMLITPGNQNNFRKIDKKIRILALQLKL
jgi:hypothetical protein